MPFTPFHLGPALLAKGVLPRRFSFAAFAASQVAIDCETLYWLEHGEWPVHRTLHTFAAGALVGTAVAVATSLVARPLLRRVPGLGALPVLAAEARLGPAIAGGLAGGLSHSLLDGIMHADMHPFRPFTTANPLLGLLDDLSLETACVAAGVLGVILLSRRRLWRDAPRQAGVADR
jgi:hypothetical protein